MTRLQGARFIESLESTFIGLPRPRCTKRVARALDDEWYPDEERVDSLRRLDSESVWSDVSSGEIRQFCDVLFWISPEGFRFYYPAWLCYSLVCWEDPHDGVQMETLEVIGRRPDLVEDFTCGEAMLCLRILEGMRDNETGCDYDVQPSIAALQRITKNTEQDADGDPL